MLRRFLVVVPVLLVLASAFPARVVAGRGIDVPKDGCLLGAFLGSKQQSNLAQMQAFNERAGKRHALFHRFVPIQERFAGESGTYTVEAFCNDCEQAGASPMLTVEPWRAKPDRLMTDEDVELLKQFADACGQWGRPMLVRFAHEMNGKWYPWGAGSVTPRVYVEGFRLASRIFQERAPNVGLVWGPNENADMPKSYAYTYYGQWYPGDEYVDWVGLSTVHWWNRAINFDQFSRTLNDGAGPYGDFYHVFSELHGKPMIVAETACGDDHSGYYDNWGYPGVQNERGVYGTTLGRGAQQWWIGQVYRVGTHYPAVNAAFPMLKAVLWFNSVRSSANIDFAIGGWDLTRHSVDYAAYRAGIGQPYFCSEGTQAISSLRPTHIGAAATPSAPAYGRPSILSARVLDLAGAPISGRRVVISSSYDRARWTVMREVWTTTYPATLRVVRTNKTYYWLRFASDDEYVGSSATLVVYPRVYLSGPRTPSIVTRGRYFTLWGVLKPRHRRGAWIVRLYGYRLERGRWVLRKRDSAVNVNYSTYTKYVQRLKLPYPGRWRIRALHPRDSYHYTTYSGYRYLYVR